MKQEIQRFVTAYVKELESGTAAIFAGAGLSKPAGYVNWKELLNPIAEDLDLDVEKEDDLVALAQFHLNKNAHQRHELTQLIIEEFQRKVSITDNHRILARLPIETFWTTNYDNLIERALQENSKNPDVKFTVKSLSKTVRHRDATVYKMHGDISLPDEVILTRDDYERYHKDYSAFVTALSGDLVDKTFLFIGFSFTDPNLQHVLSRIRSEFSQHQRTHYCFLKKVERWDDEPQEDFEYRQRRHSLVVADLMNYNIKVLEIDEYSEVTEALEAIEQTFRRRTVFISGSAHEYGDWGAEKADKFLVELGQRLIASNFKVITGMGLGVGNSIISGALNQIYMEQKDILHDEIVMRPFPQSHNDEQSRQELWEAYRQDMAHYAGVSIFVFGNKLQDGKVVDANGVRREFEIAIDQGHVIIPVGATGYVAEQIWKEVHEKFEEYYPNASDALKKEFERLMEKDASIDDLTATIIKILRSIVK